MSQQNNFGEALTFYADRHPEPLKRTAMNVQYTSSRLGLQTLSIEMTTINSPGESPDWASKTIIQLTKSELTGLCGVLFGLKSEVKASFHGENKNKGMAVYNNGAQGAAVTISVAGRHLHHFLSPDDRLELGVFTLRRLSDAWKVTPSDALAILRQNELIRRSQ